MPSHKLGKWKWQMCWASFQVKYTVTDAANLGNWIGSRLRWNIWFIKSGCNSHFLFFFQPHPQFYTSDSRWKLSADLFTSMATFQLNVFISKGNIIEKCAVCDQIMWVIFFICCLHFAQKSVSCNFSESIFFFFLNAFFEACTVRGGTKH